MKQNAKQDKYLKIIPLLFGIFIFFLFVGYLTFATWTEPVSIPPIDNVEIPQGIQGHQGPQGRRGPTGPRGLQGHRGLQGSTGPQGSRGPRGHQGANIVCPVCP